MRALSFIAFLSILLAVPEAVSAAGSARIQQANGDVRSYPNVRIVIENKQMSVTSADGVGKLVFQKAACSAVGKLIRCYPYAAVLYQRGQARQINIERGTAWLNPTAVGEQLPRSSTMLPPRGVLLSVLTKAGTYLSLTGTVDQLKR